MPISSPAMTAPQALATMRHPAAPRDIFRPVLEGLGVAPDPAGPELTSAATRATLQRSLTKTLGMATKKAVAVIGGIAIPASEATIFSSRLAGLDQGARVRLKASLHYARAQRGTLSAGDRLNARSLVAVAFARGKSLDEIEALRHRFDAAVPADRASMLRDASEPALT